MIRLLPCHCLVITRLSHAQLVDLVDVVHRCISGAGRGLGIARFLSQSECRLEDVFGQVAWCQIALKPIDAIGPAIEVKGLTAQRQVFHGDAAVIERRVLEQRVDTRGLQAVGWEAVVV